MNTSHSPDRLQTGTLKEGLKGIDLGDQRRNRRACAVIEQLDSHPRNGIPCVIGGWRETKAAYTLLAHL